MMSSTSFALILISLPLCLNNFFLEDLPNNMIHQVAIKSLPQDWLWCETWCDDESKQRAKTIDLVSVVLFFFCV